MVEAFLVEVRLSALRSLGVPQISKGDDPISADHVIKLLKDTNNAQVTAGAKLTVSQNSKAKSDSTVRQCISTGTPEQKKTEYVDVGTSLLVEAEIESREKILVNLDFAHSGVRAGNTDGDCAPPLMTMNWTLNVFLDDGRPTIVGATQDVQTAAFLIVTASIKD
jgi:type II secretory pathway component GspD/PulD (secretin)